jgi:recombination protein RecA
MEIVQKRGSWFSYNGTQLAQGRDAAKELLKGDPVIYADIETKVKEGLEAKKKK